MESRTLLVCVALFVVAAVAMDIGRPPLLQHKMNARKSQLGVGAVAAAEEEQLDRLRVAAAERETHLADRIDLHMDLSDHAQVQAQTEVLAQAEAEAKTEVAAEAEAEVEAEVDAEAAAGAQAEVSMEALNALEFVRAQAASTVMRALKNKNWQNCAYSTSKSAGATKLTAVSFLSTTPAREESFIVDIDGAYQGPAVTGGSVTLQIAQETGDSYALVYRHAIRLRDVLTFLPLHTGKVGATMFVPQHAFNLMAPAGDYVLTVVFTNQNRKQFACAKVDFKLA